MNSDKDEERDLNNVPRKINSKDTDFEESAKKWKSSEKIEINESGLGRDASQDPYDEQFEKSDAQIDNATIKIQENLKEESADSTESKVEDDRDNGESTEDWNVEHNRTGRRK